MGTIAYVDNGIQFKRRIQIKYSIPIPEFFKDPKGWEEWVDNLMTEMYGADGLGKDPIQLKIEEALRSEINRRRING